jgi:hypothetical protein
MDERRQSADIGPARRKNALLGPSSMVQAVLMTADHSTERDHRHDLQDLPIPARAGDRRPHHRHPPGGVQHRHRGSRGVAE